MVETPQGKYNVFISYVHTDADPVAPLRDALDKKGFKCWLDDRIEVGADWWQVVQDVISASQVVLVAVGARREALSSWVRREIAVALQHDVKVVPLLLDGATMPWKLGDQLGSLEHEKLPKQMETPNVEALAKRLRQLGVGTLADPLDLRLTLEHPGGLLKDLDPVDQARLELLAGLTVKHFRGTPGPGFPTVHGLRHSNGLLAVLDQLLPEAVRLDRHAVFCLAAAACVHDWGRFKREPDPKSATDHLLVAARHDHHRLSGEEALDMAGEASLTPREVAAIHDLCHYHNFRTNPQQLLSNPENATLAALFRVANACDIGPLRGPSSYWNGHGRELAWSDDILKKCFPLEYVEPPEDKPGDGVECGNPGEQIARAAFWLQNAMISDVRIENERNTVTLMARVPSDSLRFVPEQIRRNLDRLLAQLRPWLGHWDVHSTTPATGGVPGFHLQDYILLGAPAYTDPLAAVSSSSEIASYFVEAVLALTPPKGVSLPPDQSSDPRPPDEILQRLSNGLRKDRPELQLLHWLDGELRTSQGACNLRERFETIKQGNRAVPLWPVEARPNGWEADHPQTAIARHAFDELQQKVRVPGEARFLVFGHSRPVNGFIRHCALAGLEVTVCTPLMRPVGEGATLQVAEQLAGVEGVSVKVIPDAALASVACECDVALMGCEVWLDGAVASSLGCRTFAAVVEHCEKSLWVLAEDAKKLTGDNPESPYSCVLLSSDITDPKPHVPELPAAEGFRVNHKRVARIWRQEGLKGAQEAA